MQATWTTLKAFPVAFIAPVLVLKWPFNFGSWPCRENLSSTAKNLWNFCFSQPELRSHKDTMNTFGPPVLRAGTLSKLTDPPYSRRGFLSSSQAKMWASPASCFNASTAKALYKAKLDRMMGVRLSGSTLGNELSKNCWRWKRGMLKSDNLAGGGSGPATSVRQSLLKPRTHSLGLLWGNICFKS